jgi:hypothetical protein
MPVRFCTSPAISERRTTDLDQRWLRAACPPPSIRRKVSCDQSPPPDGTIKGRVALLAVEIDVGEGAGVETTPHGVKIHRCRSVVALLRSRSLSAETKSGLTMIRRLNAAAGRFILRSWPGSSLIVARKWL